MIDHPEYNRTEVNLDVRVHVMKCSLSIESLITKLIVTLLGIDDRANALALGNRSTEISFDAKINLLHDLGYLNEVDLKCIRPVMKIRNKCLHNIEANNFIEAANKELRRELCSEHTKFQGAELEDKLKEGYDNLVKSSLDIIQSRISTVIENGVNKYQAVLVIINQLTNLTQHLRLFGQGLEAKTYKLLREKRITNEVQEEILNFINENVESYKDTLPYKEWAEVVGRKDFKILLRDIFLNKI